MSRRFCFTGLAAEAGAGAFQRVDEDGEAAVDIAGRDLLGRGREARQQRRGTAGIVGVEARIELTARFGQHQPPEQVRPALRYAEADVAAAGMAHQVDRAEVELLDEGDDVADMLGDRIGVANTIPFLRKEVPQADGDQPMPLGQRAEHAAPDPEVVERAVHADQRRPAAVLAHVEIGHVVTVDVEALHSGLARQAELLCKIPGNRVDRNYFQA